MKWSFASVGLIVLGLTGVAIIMLFQQITTNNENDYYLLKEVTEAAMIDAIDISYYRETGNLKIVTEKFVENFTRRFAESTVFVASDYKISFYDIIETPPKVSIVIDTGLGEYTIHGNSDEYNIANKLDAILEYTGKYTDVSINDAYYGNPYVSKILVNEYYAMPSKNVGGGYFDTYYSFKVPSELIKPNIKNVSISDVNYLSGSNYSQVNLNEALLNYELSFNDVSTNYMQSINDFAMNISNVNIKYYNCGITTNEYKCDDINKYWVHISGQTSDVDKSKVIFRYRVTWSYEEYEF